MLETPRPFDYGSALLKINITAQEHFEMVETIAEKSQLAATINFTSPEGGIITVFGLEAGRPACSSSTM